MSEVVLRPVLGGNPEDLFALKQRAQPKQEDLLYAVERQKSRILSRTEQGLDVDGRPFEPYNSTRPYYYYPNGRIGTGKFTAAQNRDAAKRLAKKIGHTGRITQSGGIRFASYAAFKATLGRLNPDLRGPRAPHMLQAIVASSSGDTEAKLGIYGDAAGRASAHNSGYSPKWNSTHQRRFIGASTQDVVDMQTDIATMVRARFE